MKLVFHDLRTNDDRWLIQREHGLHEPPYYWIMRGPVGFRELAQTNGIDTGFYAEDGGLRACKRAAQRLEDLIETLDNRSLMR